MQWILVIVAVLMIGFCVPQAAGDTARWFAFTDVTVVPMDRERLLEHQTVLIRGDRIAAIGAADSIPVPAGTARVDGRQGDPRGEGGCDPGAPAQGLHV